MKFLSSDPSEPVQRLGATPKEELDLTDSEVNYIQRHSVEDRRIARHQDMRMQKVEKEVYYLALTMKWLLGIVSAGFVGLLLKGRLG